VKVAWKNSCSWPTNQAAMDQTILSVMRTCASVM
jgi:hypothetical protein